MPWIKVCEAKEIPFGQKKDFKVEHKHILIYNIETGWKASSVRCPHAGAMMTPCDTKENQIECCFHGWLFDLDSGECNFPKGGPALEVFKTKEENGEVFVFF